MTKRFLTNNSWLNTFFFTPSLAKNLAQCYEDMTSQQHQKNNMLTRGAFVNIPIATCVTMKSNYIMTYGNTKVLSLIHIIKKLHMLTRGINHGRKILIWWNENNLSQWWVWCHMSLKSTYTLTSNLTTCQND
jgi:hypothetical protein